MTQATARHILVESEEQCLSLKKEIEAGLDFAEAAKTNSSCPSYRGIKQDSRTCSNSIWISFDRNY